MDAPVFVTVLTAAFLHAGWNAVVKVGLDRFSSVLLLSIVQSGLALALLAFFPPPAAVRGGSVCLDSLPGGDRWNSAGFRLPRNAGAG
jgi:hypothetical protein